MKDNRREQARIMRLEGWSLAAIARELKAAKSSVSIWTRDLVVSTELLAQLKRNSHTKSVIEKRRLSRLSSEKRKRDLIIEHAQNSIDRITKRDLKIIGTMLYWAEGGKTQRTVRFSNGDPEMIRVMMRFFREICKVEEQKLRGHIHIHENLDVGRAENYWSDITGIPKTRFYKTYNKPNISSKGTRTSLPYGVFDIYISDVKLFLRIQGWTLGIAMKINGLVGTTGFEPVTSRM